jgi:hypothetical protein
MSNDRQVENFSPAHHLAMATSTAFFRQWMIQAHQLFHYHLKVR